MRIRRSMRRVHRRGRADGVNWLSFSDLMSSLLLMFILIMFYIMYQYFDMYEVNMAEIARQQFDLDQANASLEDKTAKLTQSEQQLIAQQIRLDAAQKELEDAENVLQSQRTELQTAQGLLSDREQEIARQRTALEALSGQLAQQQATLNDQQSRLDQQQSTMDLQRQTLEQQQATMAEQQSRLDQQQSTMDLQRQTLEQQQATMAEQQSQLDAQQSTMDLQRQTLEQQQATVVEQQARLEAQQQTLENQQSQIEQLVGLRPRLISSLSEALRSAKISAQVDPSNGSIALESDVLFETNKYVLTERGKRFIDRFLPVYLNVLLSEDYRPYVTEIIIEGHTDSTGDYINNLKLSQQRALAVASYVLADNYGKISAAHKQLLRKLATANGRSESDPVLDSRGREDMDASRRVVFKFRMTDEQMIAQLKTIMEKDD